MLFFLLIFSAMLLFLTGCGEDLTTPFNIEAVSAYSLDSNVSSETAEPFAYDLCVAGGELVPETVNLSSAEVEGLFNVAGRETLIAKGVHNRMNPASITKVMTALIALKYGNLSDVLIASNNVKITESGAQVIPLREGDKMTLEAALHALLMYSANDVAIMIAEYISGSEAAFVDRMNSEARALGATNTNFANPHGLTDENHYTTAYDLYLIFNEAVKNPKFVEILQKPEYSFKYADAEGNSKELSFMSSNMYLSGGAEVPAGVTVIGGKTGTTKAAGSCLILLSRNETGDPCISVVLNAESRETLYDQMSALLAYE